MKCRCVCASTSNKQMFDLLFIKSCKIFFTCAPVRLQDVTESSWFKKDFASSSSEIGTKHNLEVMNQLYFVLPDLRCTTVVKPAYIPQLYHHF